LLTARLKLYGYVFIQHFLAHRETWLTDFWHPRRKRQRLMCTLCSTPTRPFVGPSRLLSGKGASAGCAAELRALGVLPSQGAVLLVADSAVLDLELHHRAQSSLDGAGFAVLVAPGVTAEPTPDTVRSLLPDEGVAVAAVLAVGGGSALDAAKLVSVSLANSVDLTAGMIPAAEIVPGPPIVAVPTTAGTGAEVTAVAMLWHDGGKRMFVHPQLVPRVVLIDPELLLALPPAVTASGGFDAIGHAIESLLSTFRTPLTISAAREALSLLSKSLPAAYERGDLEARYGTALGAYQAGLALNASVVLGHSLAYAIASRTGLPHGVTVAMALPYCLAHARTACEDQIADMAEIVCGEPDPELFIQWIVENGRRMRIPTSLAELGVPYDALPAMAADCVDGYPRPNHPVPIDQAGVLALLERMHAGEPYDAWQDSFRLSIDSEAHA
jgi:alcohol dehydrogenase class IV